MESDKVQVGIQEYKGHRAVYVDTNTVSFSFDAAHTSINDWTAMLLAAIEKTNANTISLSDSKDVNTTCLYFFNDQLTLEMVQRGAGDRTALSIALPRSITLSLLTRVVSELAKYQGKPILE
jgi:hypothetical protein